MSTKHGRHGQGLVFYKWLNFYVDLYPDVDLESVFPIPQHLKLNMHNCTFTMYCHSPGDDTAAGLGDRTFYTVYAHCPHHDTVQWLSSVCTVCVLLFILTLFILVFIQFTFVINAIILVLMQSQFWMFMSF